MVRKGCVMVHTVCLVVCVRGMSSLSWCVRGASWCVMVCKGCVMVLKKCVRVRKGCVQGA